ncbi:MAG: hypothetical protein MUF87_05970 [Anaerolineae bacterium]|jgi:tetratricopeptide (TPR) repeat protein|nr:hypothetical protein [Anaerolineae bacterium]
MDIQLIHAVEQACLTPIDSFDQGPVMRLHQLAADRQKKGDLSGAKHAYLQALHFEPYHPETYTALGQVYYLLQDRETAIAADLTALHLIIGSNAYARFISPFKVQLSDHVHHTILQFHPLAETLFRLEQTRHLAHAVIDLASPTSFKFYQKHHICLYRRHLQNQSVRRYDGRFEQQEYMIPGGWFALNNLRWAEICDLSLAPLVYITAPDLTFDLFKLMSRLAS